MTVDEDDDFLARNVKMWALSQSDLPIGWRLTRNVTSPNCYKIKWKHPVFGVDFSLLSLRVNDETVSILDDSRVRVEELLRMSPDGFSRELKFFNALETRTEQTPRWFVKILRSGSFLDKIGVDGFAQICIRDEKLKIPFQIKSSRTGTRKFIAKYPQYKDVVQLVRVDDRSTDEVIRQRLYSVIGTVRRRITTGSLTVQSFKILITESLQYQPKKTLESSKREE